MILVSKIQAEKKCRKIYVLLLDYMLGNMSGDNLACKIRELSDEITILKSAYEVEDNMVAKLKQKKENCIVVDIIIKLVSLTSFMGGRENNMFEQHVRVNIKNV
jgi:DNA-binding response OmpR family regulator